MIAVATVDLVGGAVLVGIGALVLLVDSCRCERRYTRRHHRPNHPTRPDNRNGRNQ